MCSKENETDVSEPLSIVPIDSQIQKHKTERSIHCWSMLRNLLEYVAKPIASSFSFSSTTNDNSICDYGSQFGLYGLIH